MTIRQRMGFIGFVVLALIAVLASQLTFSPGASAQGDEDDQCTVLVADALSQAQAACVSVERGQACFDGVAVTATGAETASADAEPSVTDLAALDALSTSAADMEAGMWGVAVLKLAADLPAENADAVTAILYGGATIARPSQEAAQPADGPTLTVSNTANEPANLRSGAGVNFGTVAQLQPGESVVADGRNDIGDWVRVQIDGSAAWVFARVITWDGDLMTLPVLAVDDVSLNAPVQEAAPFQAFTLSGTSSESCPSAEPGLLLQYTGEQPAMLVINQTTLTFSDATLLVTARATEALDVHVIGGSVSASAHGASQNAAAGSAVTVALGGEDGLTPTAAPTLQPAYAFADVANAPLDLLPGAMACVVGVPGGATDVTLRVGPGEQRGPIAHMDPNQSYAVLGWTNDPEGAPWWQLDTGEQKTWVAQSEVAAVGACSEVVQVEAPPMVFAAPSAPTGEDGEVPMSTIDDLAPEGNSVWQMIPGTDNMTGECSGAPAINFCDHLAAIQPAQGGIMWKGMEASPYYLQQMQANVYAYAGPNVIGTGTVSMTLTFTADNALKMTQTLTLASEPNCQHTYYYTGTRNW